MVIKLHGIFVPECRPVYTRLNVFFRIVSIYQDSLPYFRGKTSSPVTWINFNAIMDK